MHWFFNPFQADDHSQSEGSINSCSAAQCCGWGRCVPIFRKNVMWIVFGCNTFLCYVSGNPWFFHAIFHHCSRVEAMLKAWGRDQDCWANDEVRLCFWVVLSLLVGHCPFYLCRLIEPKETCLAHLFTEQYNLRCFGYICFYVCPLLRCLSCSAARGRNVAVRYTPVSNQIVLS